MRPRNNDDPLHDENSAKSLTVHRFPRSLEPSGLGGEIMTTKLMPSANNYARWCFKRLPMMTTVFGSSLLVSAREKLVERTMPLDSTLRIKGAAAILVHSRMTTSIARTGPGVQECSIRGQKPKTIELMMRRISSFLLEVEPQWRLRRASLDSSGASVTERKHSRIPLVEQRRQCIARTPLI